VLAAPARIWAGGETGLMSIVADPKVASNSRFYTCTGWREDGRTDVRVHAWRLNDARSSARIVDTLVSGIQVTSGRHGGCRLRLDRMGRLYVGTGDAAVGTNPQNLHSLNGKVLRLNRFTGNAATGNPFIKTDTRRQRLIYTYGHRNVQGLALRPNRRMWSVEHGTYRDDEANVLFRGGNYGWNPVPGYDESKPMTDFSLPGKQYAARWSSGDPTIATSGAVWVRGRSWGAYQGTLAVCALAGERLLFMKFDDNGRLRWVRTPPALRGTYGRLRSVVQAADRDLLIATSNGSGTDKIVRVSPVRG
nr:PQQ-dependent sugar dehydrogenase [Nocardioidaceae bacterium]